MDVERMAFLLRETLLVHDAAVRNINLLHQRHDAIQRRLEKATSPGQIHSRELLSIRKRIVADTRALYEYYRQEK